MTTAVLPLMAAALLADGESCLRRVPKLTDVRTLGRLLEHLGATVRPDNGGLLVDAGAVAGLVRAEVGDGAAVLDVAA